MAGIVRITSKWEGFAGAPGYTNLYCQGGVDNSLVAQAFADDIFAWWTAMTEIRPGAVTITVGPIWDVIEDSTGNLIDQGTLTTPPAVVTGGAPTTYAGNAGFAVNWGTDVFVDGHRLKGRTYVVPATNCFQADGTLDPAFRTAMTGWAEDLIDSGSVLVVWHRPVGGVGGSSSPVTGATITDRAAILRSRSV